MSNLRRKNNENKKLLFAGLVATSILGLASCGGSSAGTLKTKYVSDMKTEYQNMRPGFNLYLFIERFQTLETYSDGSYVFTVVTTNCSSLTLAPEGNDHTASPKLMAEQKFYGTYEEKVNALDETSVDYTLSSPTRYTLVKYGAQTGNMFIDTANWTETMSQEAGLDENKKPIFTSGEEFLKQEVTTPGTTTSQKLIWTEAIVITAATTTHQFDYVTTATPNLVL